MNVQQRVSFFHFLHHFLWVHFLAYSSRYLFNPVLNVWSTPASLTSEDKYVSHLNSKILPVPVNTNIVQKCETQACANIDATSCRQRRLKASN